MITQEQMMELKRICEDLKTQDNRETADPVFVVFGKQRIVTSEEHEHDGHDYYSASQVETADEELANAFSVLENHGEKLPGDWEKYAYKEVNEFKAAFLTENGAKAYLKANGHNIKKPFIYAHSFYRNREMLTLRCCLQDLVNAAENRCAWRSLKDSKPNPGRYLARGLNAISGEVWYGVAYATESGFAYRPHSPITHFRPLKELMLEQDLAAPMEVLGQKGGDKRA